VVWPEELLTYRSGTMLSMTTYHACCVNRDSGRMFNCDVAWRGCRCKQTVGVDKLSNKVGALDASVGWDMHPRGPLVWLLIRVSPPRDVPR